MKKVLLVDDDKGVLVAAEIMLGELGLEVVSASSGKKAVEKYAELRDEACLVILDLVMPGMGGEETLAELRKIDPKVRVVLASGMSQKNSRDKYKGLGAAAFLEKPYQLESLEKLMADLEGKPD